MELKLNLEIENMFGGDGIIRTEEVKEIKLTRKKGTKKTKADIGISTDRSTDEEQYETRQQEIQTFKMVDGKPLMRLGGIHGKLWGHLRAAGKMLADLGEDGFDSKAFVDRMMMSINLTPINVIIDDYNKIETDSIPQIMNTIGRSMIIQQFDYIPKCKVNMTMTFPEIYKGRVLKILQQAEQLAGLNKRRATIKILNDKEVYGGKNVKG